MTETNALQRTSYGRSWFHGAVRKPNPYAAFHFHRLLKIFAVPPPLNPPTPRFGHFIALFLLIVLHDIYQHQLVIESLSRWDKIVAHMVSAPTVFTSQDYISDHLWKASIA